MKSAIYKEFCGYFDKINDTRINRKKLYSLSEMLFVCLCGSICGCESWRDFVDFGNIKIDFFRKHYPYENGIPSKNTFARMFASLNTEEFKTCFREWTLSIIDNFQGVIAIDGKTLRGSKTEEKSAIHMVSAFACGLNLVLAQEKTQEKSNEITAIPELLKLLEIENNIVTIDAMGCQKSIAKQIINQNGDYILALKGNQESLNDDVRLFLDSEIEKHKANNSSLINSYYENIDTGHGRVETRKCYVSSNIEWLANKDKWSKLTSLIAIESERVSKKKTTKETRFFITSLCCDAKKIAAAVRSHWSIENNLHWSLDVILNEDNSTIRKDNAPENMAYIRHLSLNMLQNAKSKMKKDTSIKGLRKKAGWDWASLESILRENF
jgi:predicted transposase YbfD/YdcC